MATARAFVTLVFLALAGTFLVSTWIFITTFAGGDWRSLLLMHSHQFLFFPTFGLLAMVAFYVPAVVFTHMYWTRRVSGRFARTRFVAGFFALSGISWIVGSSLDGSRPFVPANARNAVWEIPPSQITFPPSRVGQAVLPLAERTPVPKSVPCDRQGAPPCQTSSARDVVVLLRAQSMDNFGFSRLIRDCEASPLQEVTEAEKAGRFCFPARQWLNAPDCCAHQARFQREIALSADAARQSNMIVRFERFGLPAKVFFVLVLMVIATMLIVWRTVLDEHYGRFKRILSRGLVIGGAAMLIWPMMDYGYYQTSQLLYGDGVDRAGWPFRLSAVMLPWTAMIAYYFVNAILDQPSERISLVVQGISGVVGVITLFGAPTIINLSQRFVSAGAYPWAVEGCAVLALAGAMYLWWRSALDRRHGVPSARQASPPVQKAA
jgi:hypothetical protein